MVDMQASDQEKNLGLDNNTIFKLPKGTVWKDYVMCMCMRVDIGKIKYKTMQQPWHKYPE